MVFVHTYAGTGQRDRCVDATATRL